VGTWGNRFRRTTLILWFCLATLAGLSAGYLHFCLSPWWLAVGLLLIAGRGSRLLGLILIGCVLGSQRGASVAQQITGYQTLVDTKVAFQVAANEDAVYGKNGQLTFVAVGITNLQTGQHLPGQVGVSGYGPTAIYQDDELIVSGKLRDGIGSYQGFISYAELEMVRHHPSLLAELRRRFGAGMLSSLPEPLASFSMGLLIGQRATLPNNVKENLQKVSLTHIIAVSGANLTIMLNASQQLLAKRSKRLSTALTLGLMLGFVLMTGGSASIVRAAFVSSFSIAAAYYGRRMRPLLIICLVAAITAFINPIYVWCDASWYLSFLAFFGVLMVSPLFQNRLPRVFHTNIVLAIALESLCAEIMSVPYILYTFGQMSFIGLLANVLVVSVIPWAMLLGLFAGLAGMLLFNYAGWFAWPAKYLLTYMLDAAQLLASLPHIFIDGIWLRLPGVLLVYSTIAVMVGILSFKDRHKSAIITDNEAINPYKNLGRMS
jgi:competence protein ComEC